MKLDLFWRRQRQCAHRNARHIHATPNAGRGWKHAYCPDCRLSLDDFPTDPPTPESE